MIKPNLQVLYQKNLELTQIIYGHAKPFVAFVLTRCDKEAILKGQMQEDGLIKKKLQPTFAGERMD